MPPVTKPIDIFAIYSNCVRVCAVIVSAKFFYQDDEFLEYEEEEQIGITVMQTVRLEIDDLGLPPDGFLGEPLILYCSIINSGRVSLNNLRVRVESDNIDTTGASVYLGRLSKGSSTFYEGMITPNTPGLVTGKLIVSGEDDAGVITELQQDFEVFIQDYGMEMGMFDRDMEFFPEPLESDGFFGEVKIFVTNYWIWLTAGAVLLIVIIIVVIKIVKRRRRQRGWDSDE